jgi:beta-xylosidase
MSAAPAAVSSEVPWLADVGDGTFRNPVLFQDFSDPDGIRVGDDYYLVCSTFSHEPGLMLLQSKDMVNWRLVGHALERLVPAEFFAEPRRGCGVWAPALRHHAGKFWIFYPDPDHGLYVITAENFAGPWSAPHLIKAGKGLIDPCPLWDDDGRAYMVHGWAKSRAGINNLITLHEIAPDGSRVLDEGRVIIDANKLPGYRTLEGPKIYKRDGWYWVFAPAGGVEEGWQSVFRSKNIWGPYEDRIVLEQGKTPVNGPHQGAWIDTPSGEHWFFHFQDRGPFGRIMHLQPMRWRDDGWPVMGVDADDDGRGEPVLVHPKPATGAPAQPILALPASDDFDEPTLGLQWQWEGGRRDGWYSLSAAPGSLRLFAQPAANLWVAPHVLTQRVLGPRSIVTTAIASHGAARAGLVVMGRDYTSLELVVRDGGTRIVRRTCRDADKGNRDEAEIAGPIAPGGRALFRVQIAEGESWVFSCSVDDGASWTDLGETFAARKGIWVGARVGVFALAAADGPANGHADVAWFRVTAE